MRTFHTIFFVLGCITLLSDAWPLGIPAYHARAVNPYYTTVGGSSIVNVFPAGYSYQTLLDDGSSTYVVYVSGPEAHQYLHHLSRSSPLPQRVAVNQEKIPTLAPSIDIETVTAAAPTPPAPTEVTTVVASTSISKSEEAKLVDITPDLSIRPAQPIAAPQAPLFQFYPFTPFSTFPVLSNYMANPFNSLMSFFGVPSQAAPGNLTSSNNNDAQASNVNSVIAPLSTRIAVESTTIAAAIAPSVEPLTESTANTPQVPPVEAVTLTASTENTSQNSENSLREETTIPVTSAVTAEAVARIVADTTTVTETIETSSTTADMTSNIIPEAVETTSSTESTVESSSASTITVDAQSTTTDEISTQSSQ